MGAACGACGEMIEACGGSGTGDLVELRCARCGTSDVYHRNCLIPLSGLSRRPRKAAGDQ
jgi:hypothetical protein